MLPRSRAVAKAPSLFRTEARGNPAGMDLDLAPIVLFIGNYGSGKTEVSINFALDRLARGPVSVADLDVVNPYFRTREVREMLRKEGVEVIVPEERLMDADLPVIVPGIKGAIEHPRGMVILDVGGDSVGATVLGSFHPVLTRTAYDMLLVVNANRPFTDTVENCLKIYREIEGASRLKATGVVGNSHLMDETDLGTIREGYRLTAAVADEMNLPLRFITCDEKLLPDLDLTDIGCPVLPVTRRMLPPWKRRENLGHRKFLLKYNDPQDQSGGMNAKS